MEVVSLPSNEEKEGEEDIQVMSGYTRKVEVVSLSSGEDEEEEEEGESEESPQVVVSPVVVEWLGDVEDGGVGVEMDDLSESLPLRHSTPLIVTNTQVRLRAGFCDSSLLQ